MKFSYTVHSISTALISVVMPSMKFNEPKSTWVIYSAECHSCQGYISFFNLFKSKPFRPLRSSSQEACKSQKRIISPLKITSRWNVQ